MERLKRVAVGTVDLFHILNDRRIGAAESGRRTLAQLNRLG